MTKETMIEPLLLNSRDSTKVLDDMNMLKRSSMMFGLLFGIFMQFSTLGANWVIISILGRESFIRATQVQLLACSLIWSLISSILLINLLKLIREIMSVAQTVEQYHSTSNNKNNNTYRPKNKHSEARLDILMTFVEGPFVGCAFAGVCLAWALSDYILGLRMHMVYSLIALLVAFGSFYCFYRVHSSDVDENDECDKLLMKDEEEEQNSTTSSTGRSNNDVAYDIVIV